MSRELSNIGTERGENWLLPREKSLPRDKEKSLLRNRDR